MATPGPWPQARWKGVPAAGTATGKPCRAGIVTLERPTGSSAGCPVAALPVTRGSLGKLRLSSSVRTGGESVTTPPAPTGSSLVPAWLVTWTLVGMAAWPAAAVRMSVLMVRLPCQRVVMVGFRSSASASHGVLAPAVNRLPAPSSGSQSQVELAVAWNADLGAVLRLAITELRPGPRLGTAEALNVSCSAAGARNVLASFSPAYALACA